MDIIFALIQARSGLCKYVKHALIAVMDSVSRNKHIRVKYAEYENNNYIGYYLNFEFSSDGTRQSYRKVEASGDRSTDICPVYE